MFLIFLEGKYLSYFGFWTLKFFAVNQVMSPSYYQRNYKLLRENADWLTNAKIHLWTRWLLKPIFCTHILLGKLVDSLPHIYIYIYIYIYIMQFEKNKIWLNCHYEFISENNTIILFVSSDNNMSYQMITHSKDGY